MMPPIACPLCLEESQPFSDCGTTPVEAIALHSRPWPVGRMYKHGERTPYYVLCMRSKLLDADRL